MNIAQPVSFEVDSVEFTFLSPEEILAVSVRRIENDSTSTTCSTPSTEVSMTSPSDPPVYHPVFMDQAYHLLRATCMYCKGFRLSAKDIHKYMCKLRLLQHGLVREAHIVEVLGETDWADEDESEADTRSEYGSKVGPSVLKLNWASDVRTFWLSAGASFGVVPEFIVRTEPEPGNIIQFAYSWMSSSFKSMAKTFEEWQTLVSDPVLTRKFTTEGVFTEIGMVISGIRTSQKDSSTSSHVHVFDDWLGAVCHWAEDQALLLGSGNPVLLFSKSLVFNSARLMPSNVIVDLAEYLDKTSKETPLWFVIFDLEGGAVNDVAPDATAMRTGMHCSTCSRRVTETTRNFIRGLNNIITTGMTDVAFGAFAGHGDVELGDKGLQAYWNRKLPRLEGIKRGGGSK
ncbi:Uncharacterized protein TCAP_01551 [Tolypocladium capitatum]|uniref:Uncharacterized protein n=1 Tax=Tolypocladium capitatum TaxID=45235 RepID=A0A2K3QLV7_9HYPO|nr:Uncharacterized protein TCAP_01551 [Tolypocladium capitatum]